MTGMMQAVLSNWGQEFVKWAPDMAVVMYDGSPDERKQLQRDRVEKGTFNVLVTHYDMVMRDKAALRKVPFSFVTVPCLCTACFSALCLVLAQIDLTLLIDSYTQEISSIVLLLQQHERLYLSPCSIDRSLVYF